MLAYSGSGPYCYTHSLAMVLGPAAPAPAVIEVLTGSPFGFQLDSGSLPYFDPYGWDPGLGLDAAMDLLGWRCERSGGGTPGAALDRLRAACSRGPVLVGPLDMGLLLYHPGTPADYVADHYVVVLAVDADTVLLHDPHGHPYATLPVEAFAVAWQAKGIAYAEQPFGMRTGFVREREVAVVEALRRSLPGAVQWLAGHRDRPLPAGSLGGAAAVDELAARVLRGLAPEVRAHLEMFAVRLGARRLSDAAACLSTLGLTEPAAIAAQQAQIVGSLQLALVTEDDQTLAAALHRLAPTYETLRSALHATL